MKSEFWKQKEVFITGHTGFKGGWLSLWLSNLGASVHGYSLSPSTEPNFFTETELHKHISSSTISDIRDLDSLKSSLIQSNASIVFHLAAQPLVRKSYSSPIETFQTNVLGTVNILEAIRHAVNVEAVINITTDKCYENKEWVWRYRENDPLGGHDPYSTSKACAELVASSYRKSFLSEAGVKIASVRAGNVIGGGDWSQNRLLPDFFRSMDSGKIMKVRSPSAVRPWQHVLEPLNGYLTLAKKLIESEHDFEESWNFGPLETDERSVSWVLDYLCKKNPNSCWVSEENVSFHEANFLKLDSSKAQSRLDWTPKWSIEKALDKTLEWHLAWKRNESMSQKSLQQIVLYENQ